MANKWLPPWGDRSGEVEHFRGFKNQVDSLFEDKLTRSSRIGSAAAWAASSHHASM